MKTFNLPKTYKRLKCKLPQNYQCGGKCQPSKNKCHRSLTGVPKSAAEWLKYVEERQQRVSDINSRRTGSSRLEVDDLGFVKRVGRKENLEKRTPKLDGNTIPEIDLHLFLQPGDKVTLKDKFNRKRTSIVTKINKKSVELKDYYQNQPISEIQSVVRNRKTYNVEQSGQWTNYIEEGLKNGDLDWDKFNLREKLPTLHKLYGNTAQAKSGKLTTDKREAPDFKAIGDADAIVGQSVLTEFIRKSDERKFPSLLKKAQAWSSKPPTDAQIQRQKRQIELTRKLLSSNQGLEKWLYKKATSDKPFSDKTRFPSVEKEEAILAAMMGDRGKKLKEVYPVYLQKLKNIEEVTGRVIDDEAEERRNRIYEILGFTKPKDSILGVKLTGDRDKDLPLVKAAYRKAAKEAHPDQGGSAAKFRKINEEWEAYRKSFDYAET